MNLLIPHTIDASFPSDHAIGTMSIAVGINKWNKVYGRLLIILSILVGISRVFVGHHYPSDVIGGYAIIFATSFLYDRFLKNIVQATYYKVEGLLSKPMSYSFPSGHTASSFAAVGIIFSTLKKFRIHAIIFASLIAFSRMYLFVHYPSDIFGGILLGLFCSKIVLKVYKNRSVSTKDYNNWYYVNKKYKLK